MMNADSTIIARELALSFGENQVLNNISFQIPAGEIFGLLGPSGAGQKTRRGKAFQGHEKPLISGQSLDE